MKALIYKGQGLRRAVKLALLVTLIAALLAPIGGIIGCSGEVNPDGSFAIYPGSMVAGAFAGSIRYHGFEDNELIFSVTGVGCSPEYRYHHFLYKEGMDIRLGSFEAHNISVDPYTQALTFWKGEK